MSVAERFGENLHRLRKQAGISQEALGFLAGLHRTEVSILERGKRLPRIDTLIKVAGALDSPPSDLLEGIVWVPARATPGGFTL